MIQSGLKAILAVGALAVAPVMTASAQIVIGGGGSGGGTIQIGAQASAKKPEQKLSPRDSLTAKLGASTVSINYGRPSKRDREIFGGLVPYDKVWRTGANEATSLKVEKDITIGGKKVPAGSYTLYTIPGKESWTLIINKETGQWGTKYDEKQDLVRVPMKVETLKDAVEQFEIKLTETELSLSWDKTKASVEVK